MQIFIYNNANFALDRRVANAAIIAGHEAGRSLLYLADLAKNTRNFRLPLEESNELINPQSY